MPAVVIDDLSRDRKTQAGSFALGFGREAGFKDVWQDIFGHAASRILNFDDHGVVCVKRANGDPSFAVDGVRGIHQEVEEYLIEPAWVAEDGRDIAIVSAYFDAILQFMMHKRQGTIQPIV